MRRTKEVKSLRMNSKDAKRPRTPSEVGCCQRPNQTGGKTVSAYPEHPTRFLVARFQIERNRQLVREPDREGWERLAND